MSSLCEAVKTEVARFLEGELTREYTICAEGPNSCIVREPRVHIRFAQDPRDKRLSSSLTYIGTGEEYNEELETHIISRLFPDVRREIEKSSNLCPTDVATEVKNVQKLLSVIRSQRVMPRDLLYFFLGYNAAYEEYHRGK